MKKKMILKFLYFIKFLLILADTLYRRCIMILRLTSSRNQKSYNHETYQSKMIFYAYYTNVISFNIFGLIHINIGAPILTNFSYLCRYTGDAYIFMIRSSLTAMKLINLR